MERNDKNENVIELKPVSSPKADDRAGVSVKKAATNPIAKNFIKFFVSPKGKFSIKDILR